MKPLPPVERNWKRIQDFTDEERGVIADRLRYQPTSELAEVFRTTPQTIAAIARQSTPALALTAAAIRALAAQDTGHE